MYAFSYERPYDYEYHEFYVIKIYNSFTGW